MDRREIEARIKEERAILDKRYRIWSVVSLLLIGVAFIVGGSVNNMAQGTNANANGTSIPITKGGTGATTPTTALQNLGIPDWTEQSDKCLSNNGTTLNWDICTESTPFRDTIYITGPATKPASAAAVNVSAALSYTSGQSTMLAADTITVPESGVYTIAISSTSITATSTNKSTIITTPKGTTYERDSTATGLFQDHP